MGKFDLHIILGNFATKDKAEDAGKKLIPLLEKRLGFRRVKSIARN